MGGRELKEDIQKLQKITGLSYKECLNSFIKSGHKFDKALEILNSLSKQESLFNE